MRYLNAVARGLCRSLFSILFFRVMNTPLFVLMRCLLHLQTLYSVLPPIAPPQLRHAVILFPDKSHISVWSRPLCGNLQRSPPDALSCGRILSAGAVWAGLSATVFARRKCLLGSLGGLVLCAYGASRPFGPPGRIPPRLPFAWPFVHTYAQCLRWHFGQWGWSSLSLFSLIPCCLVLHTTLSASSLASPSTISLFPSSLYCFFTLSAPIPLGIWSKGGPRRLFPPFSPIIFISAILFLFAISPVQQKSLRNSTTVFSSLLFTGALLVSLPYYHSRCYLSPSYLAPSRKPRDRSAAF